jgi:hypothetical protein
MSWEVGNELPYGTGGAAEFTRWTGTISRFIKSIAPDQLVMDGALQLDPGDLATRGTTRPAWSRSSPMSSAPPASPATSTRTCWPAWILMVR